LGGASLACLAVDTDNDIAAHGIHGNANIGAQLLVTGLASIDAQSNRPGGRGSGRQTGRLGRLNGGQGARVEEHKGGDELHFGGC
jgi:hypothetical protein